MASEEKAKKPEVPVLKKLLVSTNTRKAVPITFEAKRDGEPIRGTTLINIKDLDLLESYTLEELGSSKDLELALRGGTLSYRAIDNEGNPVDLFATPAMQKPDEPEKDQDEKKTVPDKKKP